MVECSRRIVDNRGMASETKQSPAMEFLMSALKDNPKSVYADLKAKADEKKLKVFPIMFGRAQAMLGIVKMAKRGSGKAAKAKAAKVSAPAATAGSGKRGRQPDANSKSGQIRELLSSGMSAGDIAQKVGCTPALVYNVKARMAGGTKKRGTGRPPKASSAPSMASSMAKVDGLAGILSAVQGAERERVKLRGALEKIQAVLRDVMA